MSKCLIKCNVLCQIFTCVHLQVLKVLDYKLKADSHPERCNQKMHQNYIQITLNFFQSEIFLCSFTCLNAGLIWLYLRKYTTIVKLCSTTNNWFAFAVRVLGCVDENFAQWKFVFIVNMPLVCMHCQPFVCFKNFFYLFVCLFIYCTFSVLS